MNKKINSFNSSTLAAKVMMLLLSMAFLISCSDDEMEAVKPTQNIVALAQSNSDLTSLVSALTKYPDLVSTLQGSGTFTVFAPTNKAFADLLTATGQSSLDDLSEEVLRDVLTYHVLNSAAVESKSLTNGEVGTVNGENISVNISSGVKLNNSSNVVIADIKATNGVVHVVDAVLVPPSIRPIIATVVAPAFFNKNFSTLTAAIKAASPSVLTALLGPDKKTVFAPTNAAFAAAGITSLPDQATLNAVLTYHVLAGEVLAADIASGSSSAPTLNGKSIYLSKGSAGVFINGTTKVTTTDIKASNGVIHVIDRTLLPPSKTIAEIVVASAGASTPQFTQLLAAVAKVPALLDAASSAGNLTVFAPTDAAFQSLYTALGVDNMDELEAAIGNEKLAKVLQHHIVGARVFSTDLASGDVTTLNQKVVINVSNLTVTDANGSTPASNLVPTLLNIHATNGVIHVIDKVLIPTGIL
jgi:transforming growth factor-beta-induced protein